MSGKHSEITAETELHVAKGFTEASTETALTKNAAGATEWAAISGLGGTGPTGSTGPAGSTLATRKTTARAATAAAGTLASDFENGDVIDGVTLATNDVILIKDQSNLVENGLYSVNSSGTPTRASGMSAATAVSPGDYLWVEEGSANISLRFQVATSSTVGADNLQFDKAEDIKELPPQSITENINVTGAQANIAYNDTSGTGSSSTHTLDWNTSNSQIIDLEDFSGDVTLTLSNPKDGSVYTVFILQGSVARDVIWPAEVSFPGGTPPIITTTDNKADLVSMIFSSVFNKYCAIFNQNFGV